MKQSTNPADLKQTLYIIKRLWPYIWVDQSTRRYVTMAMLSVGLMILCNLLTPIVFRAIINQLSLPSLENSQHYIIMLALLYAAIWTAGKMSSQLQEVVMFKPMEQGVYQLSLKLFTHLINLSLDFHKGRKTGVIASSLERAGHALPNILWGLLLFIIPTVVEIAGVTILITWWYGWSYGLVILCTILGYGFYSIKSTNSMVTSYRQYNIVRADVSNQLVDTLLNYETVRYFNNQEYEHLRADVLLIKQREAGILARMSLSLIGLWQYVIVGIGLLILTIWSGVNVYKGLLSVGDFVLINGYILQFVTPLNSTGYFVRKMRESVTSMEQIIQLLDVKPDIIDSTNARPLDRSQPLSITFKDVSFGYTNERPILNSINFTIPAGATAALVGPTGSGKSTIARLLFKFYQPTQGSIYIGSQNIADVTQASLEQAIGVVPQDTVLFNNTIYYNIAYGNPLASREQVEQAARMAELEYFISQLPDGYQTMVGERGLKLSGGEKQRIAIARVILKNPSIYIFDEATSALDTVTESSIVENMHAISAGTTTVIVAHRLSTIVYADIIIVLKDGQVAEQGSHEQLLAQNGLYAKLWHEQTQTH